MSLMSLIAALLLDRIRPLQMTSSALRFFENYLRYLRHHLNAGEYRYGVIAWLLVVLPALLGTSIAFKLANHVHPILGWLVNVLVLYFTISFYPLVHHLTAVYRALLVGHLEHARSLLSDWSGQDTHAMQANEVARAAIERVLLSSYRQGFGVMLWFVLFSMFGLGGAAGAALYRLSHLLYQHWGDCLEGDMVEFGKFSRQAEHFLNWLPLRLTAITFALAGNFEDTLHAWRTQAANWPDPEAGILLASGAGSLGVRLVAQDVDGDAAAFDLGDGADADLMQSTIGLIWRSLAFILILLLLLTGLFS